MNKKKKIIISTIILTIIIIIYLLSTYLYNWVTYVYDPEGPYAIFYGEINETSDCWNITVNYIGNHYRDDIILFWYNLEFFDGDSNRTYQEVRNFYTLIFVKSEYVNFIDNDDNNRVTNNDVIIIKKYYNVSLKYSIKLTIMYYDLKEHASLRIVHLERDIYPSI